MRTGSQVINLVSQFLPSKAVRRSAIYDRQLFLPPRRYTPRLSRGVANYKVVRARRSLSSPARRLLLSCSLARDRDPMK